MKILVGVDGMDRSLQAIRFVARIASADHDQLTLCFAPAPRAGRPVFRCCATSRKRCWRRSPTLC